MTKNQAFLVKIGILIILSLIIMNSLAFSVERNKDVVECDTYNILDNTNLKASIISGKIHIIGNSGWVDFKNDGNCTGEGTFSNPYVIEDLVIDGGGSGSCILIENSTIFFKIVNCTVYNSGAYWLDHNAGIKLINVSNGELSNTTCIYNFHGIYAVNCNDFNISENLVNNNHDGMHFIKNTRIRIIENSVEYNYDENYYGYGGISLDRSNNNTIIGNTANYNNRGYAGIYLTGSNNNIIMDNIANGNFYGYGGISVSGSNNNIIKRNILNQNNNGIFLSSSSDNTIFQNTASHNVGGIFLDYDCEFNVISENNVSNNKFRGIYLIHCDKNTIIGNTVSYNNKSGIALESSSSNIISGNTANNNKGYGISMYESSCNNIVSENTLLDNIIGSIFIDLSCGRIYIILLFFLLGILTFVAIILFIRKKLNRS